MSLLTQPKKKKGPVDLSQFNPDTGTLQQTEPASAPTIEPRTTSLVKPQPANQYMKSLMAPSPVVQATNMSYSAPKTNVTPTPLAIAKTPVAPMSTPGTISAPTSTSLIGGQVPRAPTPTISPVSNVPSTLPVTSTQGVQYTPKSSVSGAGIASGVINLAGSVVDTATGWNKSRPSINDDPVLKKMVNQQRKYSNAAKVIGTVGSAASIGTSFIPIVGPAISAGIGIGTGVTVPSLNAKASELGKDIASYQKKQAAEAQRQQGLVDFMQSTAAIPTSNQGVSLMSDPFGATAGRPYVNRTDKPSFSVAEGGEIEGTSSGYDTSGHVVGPGGEKTDSIPMAVNEKTAGGAVIPAEYVQQFLKEQSANLGIDPTKIANFDQPDGTTEYGMVSNGEFFLSEQMVSKIESMYGKNFLKERYMPNADTQSPKTGRTFEAAPGTYDIGTDRKLRRMQNMRLMQTDPFATDQYDLRRLQRMQNMGTTPDMFDPNISDAYVHEVMNQYSGQSGTASKTSADLNANNLNANNLNAKVAWQDKPYGKEMLALRGAGLLSDAVNIGLMIRNKRQKPPQVNFTKPIHPVMMSKWRPEYDVLQAKTDADYVRQLMTAREMGVSPAEVAYQPFAEQRGRITAEQAGYATQIENANAQATNRFYDNLVDTENRKALANAQIQQSDQQFKTAAQMQLLENIMQNHDQESVMAKQAFRWYQDMMNYENQLRRQELGLPITVS